MAKVELLVLTATVTLSRWPDDGSNFGKRSVGAALIDVDENVPSTEISPESTAPAWLMAKPPLAGEVVFAQAGTASARQRTRPGACATCRRNRRAHRLPEMISMLMFYRHARRFGHRCRVVGLPPGLWGGLIASARVRVPKTRYGRAIRQDAHASMSPLAIAKPIWMRPKSPCIRNGALAYAAAAAAGGPPFRDAGTSSLRYP